MGLSFTAEAGSLRNVPALEARYRSPSIVLRLSQRVNTCQSRLLDDIERRIRAIL